MSNGVVLGSRRVLHPGELRWLRALGWLLLLGAASVLFYGLGTGLGLVLAKLAGFTSTMSPTEAPGGVRVFASATGALVLLGCYASAVRFGENRRVVELALPPLLPELLGGLLIGAGIMLLTGLVLWATGWVTVTRVPIGSVLRALDLSIQSGVMEEVVFRLVVFRLLWRAFGAWAALGLSALLFGILHLTNPNATLFATLCIAFEAGILLAAFYVLTGRAWMSIGVHAGWNFTQGWVLGAAVSGTSEFLGGPIRMVPTAGVASVLSGGAFGPEASLPALVLATAAGVALLWYARSRGRFVAVPDAPEEATPAFA